MILSFLVKGVNIILELFKFESDKGPLFGVLTNQIPNFLLLWKNKMFLRKKGRKRKRFQTMSFLIWKSELSSVGSSSLASYCLVSHRCSGSGYWVEWFLDHQRMSIPSQTGKPGLKVRLYCALHFIKASPPKLAHLKLVLTIIIHKVGEAQYLQVIRWQLWCVTLKWIGHC